MSNKLTVAQALTMLSVVFQEKKISEEFYEIYQEMLEDIPEEIIIAAVKDCLKECKFFPAIVEIREKAEPYLINIRKENYLQEMKKRLSEGLEDEKIIEPFKNK